MKRMVLLLVLLASTPASATGVQLLRLHEARADLDAGQLQIRGENLVRSANDPLQVWLAGVSLSVVSKTPAELVVLLPAGIAGQIQRLTRWTVPGTDDAFLALDATALRAIGWGFRDARGQDLDGRQLLVKGRSIRHPDGTVLIARSALELLRFLDSNGDGDITSGDPAWASLAFFIDADGDGVLDAQDPWDGIGGLMESIDAGSGDFRTGDGLTIRAMEPGCAP